MNAKRTTALLAVLIAPGALIATAANGEDPKPSSNDRGAQTTYAVSGYADAVGDVEKPKLDLLRVEVVNKSSKLKVRAYFPGVAKTYDFPIGYISAYLDTDAAHPGPEYGHFMQFWSDYRFAPTRGWQEVRTPEWSHSPEGECVEYAGIQSDKKSRLRWFEFVVQKVDGCFDADTVRVAVTTANEGADYRHPYGRTYYDHLGAKHSWTEWIPVG